MAGELQITEALASRSYHKSGTSYAELVYHIRGTADLDAVVDLAETTSPLVFRGLRRVSTDIKPLYVDELKPGTCAWEARLRYQSRTRNGTGTEDDHVSRYSINTTVGSSHVIKSLQTVDMSEGAVDHGGLMGVRVDENFVEGTDIVSPRHEWTEEHFIPIRMLRGNYRKLLAAMGGRLNENTFRGFDKGEVLFMGVTGSWTEEDDGAMLTFNFAAEKNTVEDGLNKGGWDYVWKSSRQEKDAAKTTIKIITTGTYVERNYKFADFAILEIGT